MIERWTKAGEAKSVGLLGNAAEILPEMVRRGIRPDMVTDQTSAHDPLSYLPVGVPFEDRTRTAYISSGIKSAM